MSSASISVENKIRSLPPDLQEDAIRSLPPDLQEDAIRYIDELVRRSKKRSPSSFRCVAEGSLAELGSRYSSVELQHKALEWRGS